MKKKRFSKNKIRDKYSDDEIRAVAATVSNTRQFLDKLGIHSASGGIYQYARREIVRLNIDCSHWTGRVWNRDKRLKDWAILKRGHRKHLIRDRGHVCEECKLSEWRGSPIPLAVHHIDGDRTNNNLSNLRLVCCNCHALTPNWCQSK